MVMDQFTTTYRKDFLWPYVKTFGFKPYSGPQERSMYHRCSCHIDKVENELDPRNLLGPLAYEEQSWSRLGPMGPLLEPKLYPARVSALPESKISKFNQPNTFLKKLQEKYPFIYECLRTAPPDDLISRIHRDRLRTTYQVDFDKMVEYPSAPYDELLKLAGVTHDWCESKHDEPVNLPGDYRRVCQLTKITGPSIRKKGCKNLRGSKEAAYSDENSGRGQLSSVTPGSTEYQDVISRLGYLIIRDKIHDRTIKRSAYDL